MNFIDLRQIAKGRKEFLKHMGPYETSKKWRGCTEFCVVQADGSLFMAPHSYCFSGLSDNYRGNVTPPYAPNKRGSKAMIVSINHGFSGNAKFSNEQIYKFVDWLANRSPWSAAVVSKDARTMVKTMTVVFNCYAPGNLMVGGAVVLRRLWETVDIAQRWFDFTGVGVPEDLAFYLAAACYGSVGKNFNCGRYEGGHESLNPGFSWEDLTNFLNHKPFEETGTYSATGSYTRYSRMWQRNNFESNEVQSWLTDNFPFKGAEAVKAVNNPFAKAVRFDEGRGGCKYEAALQRMGEWWPKIYEKAGIPLDHKPQPRVIKAPVVVVKQRVARVIKRDKYGRFAKKEAA